MPGKRPKERTLLPGVRNRVSRKSCRFGLICNNSHVIIRIHRNEYIERVGESMYKMVIGLNKEKIINEKSNVTNIRDAI